MMVERKIGFNLSELDLQRKHAIKVAYDLGYPKKIPGIYAEILNATTADEISKIMHKARFEYFGLKSAREDRASALSYFYNTFKI